MSILLDIPSNQAINCRQYDGTIRLKIQFLDGCFHMRRAHFTSMCYVFKHYKANICQLSGECPEYWEFFLLYNHFGRSDIVKSIEKQSKVENLELAKYMAFAGFK